MQLNKNCYYFKKILFNDGLFNKSIDATYILHVVNNGRLNNILNELKKYHPTNIVYILFNKGYKKCNKNLYVKNTLYDIVDANYEIFKHAQINNYYDILILEDDFFFDKKVLNNFHINNINNFILSKKNKEYIYHLGCQPIIYSRVNLYNNLGHFVGGVHSSVFSKKFRDLFFKDEISKISDWDIYLNYKTKRYFYYIPLCYQFLNETDNSKNYPSYYGMTYLGNYFIKKFKLDSNPVKGYNDVYYTSKYISIFISFFLFIFTIIILTLIIYYLNLICFL
jgi:hypothetical protein